MICWARFLPPRVIAVGLTCFRLGVIALLVEKADVREEMRGRLNHEELWLCMLQGRLNFLSGVMLNLFPAFSRLLSWGATFQVRKGCLGHGRDVLGTTGVFLFSSFPKGLVTVWSRRNHRWCSEWTGTGRKVRTLRKVAQPRALSG